MTDLSFCDQDQLTLNRSSNITLKDTSAVTKECDIITQRISQLNADLELKEMQLEAIKRGLDQERLLKEAAIRNLTQLMFNHGMKFDEEQRLTEKGDAFLDREKHGLKLDASKQQVAESRKFQSIMDEYEKKFREKEVQLSALNDQGTHLIRKYQRNRLEIEALNLGVISTAEPEDHEKVQNAGLHSEKENCEKLNLFSAKLLICTPSYSF